MLVQIIEIGRQAGVRVFTPEALEDNTVAVHVYEKRGFRTVGRWEQFSA